MPLAASGACPGILVRWHYHQTFFKYAPRLIVIPVLDYPQFRERLGKGNLSGKARDALILDRATNAGLLQPLLAHFDVDQALRHEDLFH